MKPENQQKFLKLIESNINAGFIRGQQLFAEAVEMDLQKNEILENHSVDDVIEYLITESLQENRQEN